MNSVYEEQLRNKMVGLRKRRPQRSRPKVPDSWRPVLQGRFSLLSVWAHRSRKQMDLNKEWAFLPVLRAKQRDNVVGKPLRILALFSDFLSGGRRNLQSSVWCGEIPWRVAVGHMLQKDVRRQG